MKKYLFISNSTKPNLEENNSREKIHLTNVSRPCIEAAINLGYEVNMGVNRRYAAELECELNVKLYNSSTYRSLVDIKSNYIAFKNLLSFLKKEEVQVIHCNTPIGGLVARICGRIKRVPIVIYTVHGFHFYKGAPLFNRTLIKWVEKGLARFTDVIITMNKEDYNAAQSFRLRKGGNVYYVPGVGIDTDEYSVVDSSKADNIKKSLGLKKDDYILIAMGDLIGRKNYSSSIKAISKLNNSKIHFLICGVGPETEKLKKLAEVLGIENNIHFLGYRTDIKELLKLSDIFLFTSKQEGLPRSLMEAMSAGLPCICSNIRGNVDLIVNGEGGLLFDSEDINGISQGIARLIENPKLRVSMGKNNLNRIKEFDVENVKKIIMSIYEKEL
ncbi:glycosyltransferase family 1 protein [Paenibacillus sp. MY03]|uniref:glycosyltransferase family 4 protein n=1 Tax=Paenibacillus sp. MY03 TaxID=302980 RepID=UPI000B3C7722|nr:glycosyltransferase family 4 protein [Paenibacillus sp. MY03]OUS69949.1 glycosyltransferase family 1 protein [Paenibacillus sp. MY03]